MRSWDNEMNLQVNCSNAQSRQHKEVHATRVRHGACACMLRQHNRNWLQHIRCNALR